MAGLSYTPCPLRRHEDPPCIVVLTGKCEKLIG
jgi:hypothetical protein